MNPRDFDIAVLTDEISRDLREALELGRQWEIRRLELREGGKARFPALTAEEIGLVEEALRHGSRVTAVSPGILKGSVDDKARLERELGDVLPRSIELAQRFGCPAVIVFGFERYAGEPDVNYVSVLRAFERAAEQAASAGMTVMIENEPNFWIDRPAGSAEMLEEIGHPALRLNWDPANSHWGGYIPSYEDFLVIRPHIANLHVKDYYPADPQAPWRPVGQGSTPWREIMAWVLAETELPHATLETHCEPLAESSRQSLESLREMVAAIEEDAHGD